VAALRDLRATVKFLGSLACSTVVLSFKSFAANVRSAFGRKRAPLVPVAWQQTKTMPPGSSSECMSAIFVHAGAGYHSTENEPWHLSVCHE
jgi:hypothetical protein